MCFVFLDYKVFFSQDDIYFYFPLMKKKKLLINSYVCYTIFDMLNWRITIQSGTDIIGIYVKNAYSHMEKYINLGHGTGICNLKKK